MDGSLSFSINSKLLESSSDDIPSTAGVNEIHVRYRRDVVERITKEIIKAHKIYKQQDLVAYIKKTFKVPVEFELVSNGKFLAPLSELFSPKGTLNVKIVHKYIRNTLEEEDINSFFEQRHINFRHEIISTCEFQKCLKELKCQVIADPQVLQSFKKEIWHTKQTNKASKGYLIRRILSLAIQDEPFLRITDQYEIKHEQHLVKADHAVIQMFSERAILICQDEDSDQYRGLYEGLILNFDQAKTYSLTEDGRQYPFIYGIVSNFNEWRICCYYVPEPGTPDSARNFYVSEKFILQNNDFDPEDDAKEAFELIDRKLSELVGLIKGLFRKDVDKTVAKILGLEINLVKEEDFTERQNKMEKKYLIEHESDLQFIMDGDIQKSHIEGQKRLKYNE